MTDSFIFKFSRVALMGGGERRSPHSTGKFEVDESYFEDHCTRGRDEWRSYDDLTADNYTRY
jgi:hypothetical protein